MTLRPVLWILVIGFFGVFFVYPLGTLLVTAFIGASGAGISGLFTASMGSVALFTFAQAALSTVLTMAVGLPGAAVLARFRFGGRGLIEALSVVAFVMPTVVVAAAVTELVPDRGLMAILVAHVYFNLAVVLRMVGAYWSQLDRRPGEAAAALGAAPLRVFWSVTVPQLRPVLWSAAAIVFLFTFTSFGIILLLGGPGMATIEVEIQRQALFLSNLPLAAALSLLQILVVGLLLIVQVRLMRSLPGGAESTAGTLRRPRTPAERAAVASFVVAGLMVLSGPLLIVVARALQVGDGWGWENFTRLGTSRADSILFVPPAEALANSLLYAGAAAIIATGVGGVIAWLVASANSRVRGWDALLLLPLGVSAVALGFGILIAFDTDPVNWRATFWMVPVAQALIALPFVVRALVPALQAIGPRVREAAATLGARPWQVWRHVELPMVWRSLLVALGFSFAISLGEFGATLFVARGDHPTVPIAIYRLLGTPGEANQGQAMALAAILIVVTATIILVTDRWRRPGSSHV